MKRLSYPILLISVLFATLLGACGPELAPNGSAQDGGPSAQPGASPTSALLAISPTAGPTELPTESIEIVTARTPVPTPDLAAATQTELDQVALTNPLPLQLPEELGQAPLGLFVWSPDSKHFLANATGDEVLSVGQLGYSVPDLYLGDGETGEVKFLAHNAGWPAWSRDGRSIYYLTGRAEGDLVRYDLYRAEPTLANPELVAPNVGDAGAQPAVSELADGRLVLLDQRYQPAIWDQGKLTTIADLVGLDAIRGKVASFSLAPDGHTLVVLGQDVPATLIDLATLTVEAQLNDTIHFQDSVAWSTDSNRLAYATADGLYVYDRAAKSERVIANRATFGFPPDDPMAGFQGPVWSPDERFLLFAATTKDWMRRGILNTDMAYLFVTPIDGTQLRALSDKALDVAPDKVRAIEPRREPETGRESPTLVNLIWATP